MPNSKRLDLADLKEIIRQNIADPQFGVERLARLSGMSPSGFRELCWLDFGITHTRLIENVRLEEALHLMAQSQHNLYEICRAVGYQNMRTFRRAFKRRLKINLKECRQLLILGKRSRSQIDKQLRTLWADEK